MEATYRGYIEALNARDFAALASHIAFPIVHNGAALSEEEYIAHLQRVTSEPMNTVAAIDLLVLNKDAPSDRPVLAARVLLDVTPSDATIQLFGLDPATNRKRVRIADHYLIWFNADNKIVETANLLDTAAIGRQLRNTDQVDLPNIARAGAFTSVGDEGINVGQRLKEWYAYSMEGAMAEHASEYLADEVAVMGMKFPRAGLVEFIAQGLASLGEPGTLKVDVQTLVVDNAKGLVSSRFKMGVKIVKAFAGIEPNGKPAVLDEQVFYQFKGGKIAAMDTVVDFAGLRRQMYGPAAAQ